MIMIFVLILIRDTVHDAHINTNHYLILIYWCDTDNDADINTDNETDTSTNSKKYTDTCTYGVTYINYALYRGINIYINAYISI